MQRLIAALKIFWAVLTGTEYLSVAEAKARFAPPPAKKPDKKAEKKPEPGAPPSDRFAEGAVYSLLLLQREGRLIDFLQEEIDGYGDMDIGRAVRQIHAGCRKVLRENFAVAPVMDRAEGDAVELSAKYDTLSVRVTGKVGEPPYRGVLRHKGWKAGALHFPERTGKVDPKVIHPCEVEVQ